MDTHDPYVLLEQVEDLESFRKFLKALAKDRQLRDRTPEVHFSAPVRGWENDTIYDFLEAANAWLDDTKHRDFGFNPWRHCAQAFIAGKIYE